MFFSDRLWIIASLDAGVLPTMCIHRVPRLVIA